MIAIKTEDGQSESKGRDDARKRDLFRCPSRLARDGEDRAPEGAQDAWRILRSLRRARGAHAPPGLHRSRLDYASRVSRDRASSGTDGCASAARSSTAVARAA